MLSRMQEKTAQEPNDNPVTYVGIDVSKARLDVHIYPSGEDFSFSNATKGHAELAIRLARLKIALIVIEATGKYHRAVQRNLCERGFPVAVVNPYRSRKFADALGQLAKTDRIDARILAQFGAMLRPKPGPPPLPELAGLKEIIQARRKLVEDGVALKLRVGQAEHALVKRQLRTRIKQNATHLAALEKAARQIIKTNQKLQHRYRILCSIPGVGFVTAATFLAEMDELGRVNGNEIAALIGVAPMNRDSGFWRGKRKIRGGRKPMRNALYMAAVAATRSTSNPFGVFYRRLIEKGKPAKIALTAVMRKMAIVANTLLKENREWVTVLT